MFSAYIIFHCLNMFYVEKQVSEFFATHLLVTKFFTTHLATRQSQNPNREFIQKLSWLAQSQNAQKQLFKKLFMGNLF